MSENNDRIWADGCYDMMHWGHANACRQSKALGKTLVVGVHSDAEVMKHKGPTIMTEDERYEAVEACKWVDEVVRGAPYVTMIETLDKHNIDYCTHGEDITLDENGVDTYKQIKDAGRMKMIKRTEGISTTDLVGRMLLCTRSHHASSMLDEDSMKQAASPYTRMCTFMPTTSRIVQFSPGKVANATDRIVYMDGLFDLFHVGHIRAMKKARDLGDFLLVGIHDDKIGNLHKGENFPIMNLLERVLAVLSCRYVDEVVIGCPFEVTENLIKQMNISVVVHGRDPVRTLLGKDPYADPKRLGIYQEIDSDSSLTTEVIIQRIIDHRKKYEDRGKNKEQKEIDYLAKTAQ